MDVAVCVAVIDAVNVPDEDHDLVRVAGGVRERVTVIEEVTVRVVDRELPNDGTVPGTRCASQHANLTGCQQHELCRGGSEESESGNTIYM